MKKALIVLGSVLLLSSFTVGLNEGADKVYICTGGSSQCYHSRNTCSGLRRCSGEIKQITLEQAQKMNRRPCKICCNGN